MPSKYGIAMLLLLALPASAQYAPTTPVPPSVPAQAWKDYLKAANSLRLYNPMTLAEFPATPKPPGLAYTAPEACFDAQALLPNPSTSASGYMPGYLQTPRPVYSYSELRDAMGKRLYAVGIKYEWRYREVYMLGPYNVLSNAALYESMTGVYTEPTSLDVSLQMSLAGGDPVTVLPRGELNGATYYIPMILVTATVYYRMPDTNREEVRRVQWVME